MWKHATMDVMPESRKHVLIWTAPEYLDSPGMIQILTELDIFSPDSADFLEIRRSAERVGGFAISGILMEVHHGAGVWVSPQSNPSLQLMVPWHFVRSLVTAEEPRSSKIFGLMTELAKSGSGNGSGNGSGTGSGRSKPQPEPPAQGG